MHHTPLRILGEALLAVILVLVQCFGLVLVEGLLDLVVVVLSVMNVMNVRGRSVRVGGIVELLIILLLPFLKT
jgi:hypothetical protein